MSCNFTEGEFGRFAGGQDGGGLQRNMEMITGKRANENIL